MATDTVAPKLTTMADLKGKVDPDWCPGCGDFGVLAAVQKALVELQIPNHEVATISGIGCSSNFPGFINTYGMHTLHGRSLAVATGFKMANHGMTVLVTGGDGDGSFGVQIIKNNGGTVIAQDRPTSENFSMPETSIKTGDVDYILPLDQIAPMLIALVWPSNQPKNGRPTAKSK